MYGHLFFLVQHFNITKFQLLICPDCFLLTWNTKGRVQKNPSQVQAGEDEKDQLRRVMSQSGGQMVGKLFLLGGEHPDGNIQFFGGTLGKKNLFFFGADGNIGQFLVETTPAF